MNKKNFDLLLDSMREAGEILRGDRKPSRQFTVEAPREVVEVRQSFHATQSEFAKFMGVSIDTLQNWEQGRRRPTGPARVLLRVVAANPAIFRQDYADRRLERV